MMTLSTLSEGDWITVHQPDTGREWPLRVRGHAYGMAGRWAEHTAEGGGHATGRCGRTTD